MQLGKQQQKMAQVFGAPLSHLGDMEEVSDSWLWLGTAMAIATFWRVEQ